jgi:hypothetical protein
MNRFPSDIQIIIAKYVHRDLYKDVMQSLEIETELIFKCVDTYVGYYTTRYYKVCVHTDPLDENTCPASGKWSVCVNTSMVCCNICYRVLNIKRKPEIRTIITKRLRYLFEGVVIGSLVIIGLSIASYIK